MSEISIQSSDPGALARMLVRRLLRDRDLAGGAAGRSPAGPLADDWMLQELCALGRGSGASWRRCVCWRTLLAVPADAEPSAH